MSTLRLSDPASDAILDFIAGGVTYNKSGESGGNYNAVIGNAHATDDLSLLDLNGIYELMADLLRQGQPSTAVGRYQLIKATMVSTVGSLGVSPHTKFTPAFQDQMCVELLKLSCRYTSWRGQVITDQQFAHLLSTQWASLPDPNNAGKSHYDGDSAGNHASTTLGAVYAMLSVARTKVGLSAPTPSPAAPDATLAAVKGLQAALGVTVDGQWGPRSQAALDAWRAGG